MAPGDNPEQVWSDSRWRKGYWPIIALGKTLAGCAGSWSTTLTEINAAVEPLGSTTRVMVGASRGRKQHLVELVERVAAGGLDSAVVGPDDGSERARVAARRPPLLRHVAAQVNVHGKRAEAHGLWPSFPSCIHGDTSGLSEGPHRTAASYANRLMVFRSVYQRNAWNASNARGYLG